MSKKINLNKRMLSKMFLLTVLFVIFFNFSQTFAGNSSSTFSPNNWPQFRFDQANTGFNQPVNDPFFKKKWSYSLGNPNVTYSSPAVILNAPISQKGNPVGMLFIGTTQGRLLALKTHDGTKLWSFQTHGEIYSSPAVLENGPNSRVFVGSSDGILRSLDLKGNKKCTLRRATACFLRQPLETLSKFNICDPLFPASSRGLL